MQLWKKEEQKLREDAKKPKPTTGKLPTKANDDDKDDPIAKSLRERIQAGGITEVVGGAKPQVKNV